MKKPVVNQDTCIGCGTCVGICGDTFQIQESGKAMVINPAGNSEEEINTAIASCPTTSISLVEE